MKKTKKELIDILLKAERYPTMNGWNRVTSLSRNVKLYNLNLTEEQFNLAYQLLFEDIQANVIDDIINVYSNQLMELTNNQYTLGFNGRSDGYVVMYSVADYKNPCDYRIACGQGFLSGYDKNDLMELSWSELNKAYKILKAFNSVVDSMINYFKYVLNHARIEEEEEEKVVINKVKVLYL